MDDLCKCHSKLSSKVDDLERDKEIMQENIEKRPKTSIVTWVLSAMFGLILSSFSYTYMAAAKTETKVDQCQEKTETKFSVIRKDQKTNSKEVLKVLFELKQAQVRIESNIEHMKEEIKRISE